MFKISLLKGEKIKKKLSNESPDLFNFNTRRKSHLERGSAGTSSAGRWLPEGG